MGKIGRNNPCPCGSGEKYKKCCLSHSRENEMPTNNSIEQILEFVKVGLSNEPYDELNPEKKVRVKAIKLLNNNNVVCEFFPYAQDSIGIKTEMGFIISFLEAFFRGDTFLFEITHFGAKAYDGNNQELLSALSSKKTAGAMGEGQAIEWLNNTIFIENSSDYRLHHAKRKISEIEQGLRKLVCIILQCKGPNWWQNSVKRKIRDSAAYCYENQNDINSQDGEELIEYTFLRELKTIVIDNWNEFLNIIGEKTLFEEYLESLNVIRRNEAHNREVSSSDIEQLERIYKYFMEIISKHYPEASPNYLIENWRIQLRDIVNHHSDTVKNIEIQKGEKLSIITPKINKITSTIQDTESKLDSVLIPPGKNEFHIELIGVFKELRESFENLLSSALSNDMINFQIAHEKNILANQNIRDFTKRYLMSEKS